MTDRVGEGVGNLANLKALLSKVLDQLLLDLMLPDCGDVDATSRPVLGGLELMLSPLLVLWLTPESPSVECGLITVLESGTTRPRRVQSTLLQHFFTN